MVQSTLISHVKSCYIRKSIKILNINVWQGSQTNFKVQMTKIYISVSALQL